MKNRRTALVAFLLVAVMLLSVGYANLTDRLTIIGNAEIDLNTANATFDSKIKFIAAEATSTTGTGTVADVASYTADDATFTANKLAIVNEYSVFEFTIENTSNVDAKISVATTKLSGADNPSNSNEEKFEVTYAYSNADMTVAKNGGTIKVTVTVKVIDPIIVETSASFGIELTATAVETVENPENV